MEFALKKYAILIFLFWSAISYAQKVDTDVYDLPKTVAIQNRQYYVNHGLTFQAGYLPFDSFNKSILLGASYTYFFSDFFGWEIVNANYAINQDTGLKADLLDNFNAEVDGILDFPTYYLTTNIVYTPLYNKSLLFNQSVVQGDLSFVFGGGLINYDFAGIGGMAQLGFILRFFTDADESLKFDFRTVIPFGADQRVNISIIVGYSFQLGSPPAGFIEQKEDEELGF